LRGREEGGADQLESVSLAKGGQESHVRLGKLHELRKLESKPFPVLEEASGARQEG
jgi:hypothetical protein